MISKYTPVAFFALAGLIILFAIFLPWLVRNKNKKVDLPETPLNRRERRAKEQKKEQFEQRCIEAEAGMKRRVADLRFEVDHIKRLAELETWSVFRFTKELLDVTEVFFSTYEREAKKMQLVTNHMPNIYYAVMRVISQDIVAYAGTSSYQPFALELMKFVERQFSLNSLADVMSRNKGQVQYNDRCEAMASVILSFFMRAETADLGHGRLLPFDYLNEAEMTSWEAFRRIFNKIAIEGSYVDIMKNTEKSDHSDRARHEREEHDNNRRQRARRIAKQSTRRRAKR